MNHVVVKKSFIFYNSIGSFCHVFVMICFIDIYNLDEAQVRASHHNGYHS